MKILNLEGKQILFSNGKIDLIEESIDFKIPKQTLYLKEFKGLFNVKDMSGNINIESEIKGDLYNPQYSLRL